MSSTVEVREPETIVINASPSSAFDFPRQMDHCPNRECENVVPATHIYTDPKRMVTRMQCPSCGRVYECPIRYVGGVAERAGQISRVTDDRRLNAMKAIVALRTEG